MPLLAIMSSLVLTAPTLVSAEAAAEASVTAALGGELSQCIDVAAGNYDQVRDCATQVYDNCAKRTPGSETTAGMSMCATTSASLVDDAMNAVWTTVRDKADDATFGALRERQRNWIAFRDDEVDAASQRYKGGSMQALSGPMRSYALTADRLARLHEIAAGL